LLYPQKKKKNTNNSASTESSDGDTDSDPDSDSGTGTETEDESELSEEEVESKSAPVSHKKTNNTNKREVQSDRKEKKKQNDDKVRDPDGQYFDQMLSPRRPAHNSNSNSQALQSKYGSSSPLDNTNNTNNNNSQDERSRRATLLENKIKQEKDKLKEQQNKSSKDEASSSSSSTSSSSSSPSSTLDSDINTNPWDKDIDQESMLTRARAAAGKLKQLIESESDANIKKQLKQRRNTIITLINNFKHKSRLCRICNGEINKDNNSMACKDEFCRIVNPVCIECCVKQYKTRQDIVHNKMENTNNNNEPQEENHFKCPTCSRLQDATLIPALKQCINNNDEDSEYLPSEED